MRKVILVIFIYIFSVSGIYSQFTKAQADELTARGIYAAIEPENEEIIGKARELSQKYAGDYDIKQVCEVFDYVYKNWNYSSDPGGMEYFEDAGVSLHTLTGDCDDYSVLIVSLVKALGGEGRIVCVSGHAYPELYLGNDLLQSDIDFYLTIINEYYKEKGSRIKVKYLNYHRDYDSSVWLNMDYQQRYPGGSFYEYSPEAEHLVIYSNGYYRLSFLNKE